MLPDFPDLKSDFYRAVRRFVHARAMMHAGIVGEIPRYRLFEGNMNSIVRPSGEEEATKMFEARSQFSVTSSEIAGLSLDQLLEKLDKVAQEIAAAQSQHMFESVNQAVTKVGNVIDAQGGPLSPALFLEMIKKVQIDFDASGKPRMPTVVIHPDQAEKVKALMSQMEASPEIKNQFDRIISIKREEWRAREADRGLAG